MRRLLLRVVVVPRATVILSRRRVQCWSFSKLLYAVYGCSTLVYTLSLESKTLADSHNISEIELE